MQCRIEVTVRMLAVGCGIAVCSLTQSGVGTIDIPHAQEVVERWRNSLDDPLMYHQGETENPPYIFSQRERDTCINTVRSQCDDVLYKLKDMHSAALHRQERDAEQILDNLALNALKTLAQYPIPQPAYIYDIYANSGFQNTRRKWPRNQDLKELCYTIAGLRSGLREYVAELNTKRKQGATKKSLKTAYAIDQMYTDAVDMSREADEQLMKYTPTKLTLKPVPPKVRSFERELEVERGKFPTNVDTKTVATIPQLVGKVYSVDAHAEDNDFKAPSSRVPELQKKVQNWYRW